MSIKGYLPPHLIYINIRPMSNNITIPSFRTINKTIQECFITYHEKRLYTWISISSILSAKNTRLAIVAIVAIVAETFNPSFVYNFRQIYQFTSHSPFPSSTPPQRSKTRNKANANDHQIVHSHQLRRLFGRNGRNGQIARGDALAMKSSELLWNARFAFIFEAYLSLEAVLMSAPNLHASACHTQSIVCRPCRCSTDSSRISQPPRLRLHFHSTYQDGTK